MVFLKKVNLKNGGVCYVQYSFHNDNNKLLYLLGNLFRRRKDTAIFSFIALNQEKSETLSAVVNFPYTAVAKLKTATGLFLTK